MEVNYFCGNLCFFLRTPLDVDEHRLFSEKEGCRFSNSFRKNAHPEGVVLVGIPMLPYGNI